MIELRNVHKAFGKQVVLNGVDFEVREGETVALLGPSGTGKSVLLKHIIGLIRPDVGEIFVDGKDVCRLKRRELSELRSHIGYVFQNGALFDSMNVFENVRLGITDEDRYGDLEYCRQRVAECIRLVNLPPDTIEKFPAQPSGKKLDAVARRPPVRRPAQRCVYFDGTLISIGPGSHQTVDGIVRSGSHRYRPRFYRCRRH